ncbi:MAG: S8 family peptidase [Promethearchaeota archaeon]
MRSIDDFQISKVESELLGKYCIKKKISPTDTLAQKFYLEEKIRVIITFTSLQFQKAWIKKLDKKSYPMEILTKSTLTQILMLIVITTYSTIIDLSKNHEEIKNIYLDRNLYMSSFSSQSTGKLFNIAEELGLPVYSKIPIALVDSGVDSTIISIEKNIEQVLNISTEKEDTDHNGHGTYISSILINSLRINGNQFPPLNSSEQISSAAKIFSIKIFTDDGKAHLSDLVSALGSICFQPEYHDQIFVKGNVKVILIPASTIPTSGMDDLFMQIIDFFSLRKIICVCSAGNFGPESIGLGYPGILKNSLTVGSITDSGVSAFYSSRGSTEDGTVLPKFYDYGKNIQGIATPDGKFCSIPLSNQTMISNTGTSTSATLVAAKIGLIKLLNPSYSINDLIGYPTQTFPIRTILQQLGWVKDGHKSLLRMILQSMGFSILMIGIFIIAIRLL